MLTVVGISDTHGRHALVHPPAGDVLVVAGDITSFGTMLELVDFNDWLGSLPHAHKIVVAGNHDLCCPGQSADVRKLFTNATYLENESVVINGVKYWSSPYSKRYSDWVFMYNPGTGKLLWDLMPADTDVLITHGPPVGLGLVPEYMKDGEECGCPELTAKILSMPRLKAMFCGHIHEAHGSVDIGGVPCMNVSCMDGRYNIKHHGQAITIA